MSADTDTRMHWDEAKFHEVFRNETRAVSGGVRIHFVRGGDGPAIVLLHGFPEHWREWRYVMPGLVGAGFPAIAGDLRGSGASDKPLEGFDVGTVAEDCEELLRGIGLGPALF